MGKRTLLAAISILSAAAGVAQEKPLSPEDFALSPGATIARGSPIPAGQRARPKEFGLDDGMEEVLSFSDFVPAGTWNTQYNTHYGQDVLNGTRWTTTGAALTTSLNSLPNGAKVTALGIYYYDDSPTHDLELLVCKMYRELGGQAAAGQDCFLYFKSEGTPGLTADFVALPDADKTFLKRQDPNGDGNLDLVSYEITVWTHGNDGHVRIGAVRPLWFRQVSPAPVTATFADVQTSDPAFQFIEALAASGVTSGCGAGNYCPDATVTRRQMAVFFAKALGLHWGP